MGISNINLSEYEKLNGASNLWRLSCDLLSNLTYLQKTLQHAEVDFDNDRTATLAKRASRVLSDFSVAEFRQSTVKATLDEPQATQPSINKYVPSPQAPKDGALEEPALKKDSSKESGHHVHDSENEAQGSSMPEMLEPESEPRAKSIVTLETKQPTTSEPDPAASDNALDGDKKASQAGSLHSSSDDEDDIMLKCEPSSEVGAVVQDEPIACKDAESSTDESYDTTTTKDPAAESHLVDDGILPGTMTPQSMPDATGTSQIEMPMSATEHSNEDTCSNEETKESTMSGNECSEVLNLAMSSADQKVNGENEDPAGQIDQSAPKSQGTTGPPATEVQKGAGHMSDEVCDANVNVDGSADTPTNATENPGLTEPQSVVDDHANGKVSGQPVHENNEETSEQDKTHEIESSQKIFVPEEEGNGLRHIFPVGCDDEGMGSVQSDNQKLVFIDGTLTNLGPAGLDQDSEISAKVAGNAGTMGEPLEEVIKDITAAPQHKAEESQQQVQDSEAPGEHYIPIEEGSGLSHVFVGSGSQPVETGVPMMVDDTLTNIRVEEKAEESSPITMDLIQKTQIQEVVVQESAGDDSATTLVSQDTQLEKEILRDHVPDHGRKSRTNSDVGQLTVPAEEGSGSTDVLSTFITTETSDPTPAEQTTPVTPMQVIKQLEHKVETSTHSTSEPTTIPSMKATDPQEASIKIKKHLKLDAGSTADTSGSNAVRVPSAESSATTNPKSRNVSESSDKTTITTPESSSTSSQPSMNAQPAAGGRKGRKRGGKKGAAKKAPLSANGNAAKEQMEPSSSSPPQVLPTKEATKKRNAQRRRAKKARKAEKEGGNQKEEGEQKKVAGSAPGAWPAS